MGSTCRLIVTSFSEDSDTISLILVVFLFIFCNFTALLVNFLELTLYEQVSLPVGWGGATYARQRRLTSISFS
jgi:hypothetical protein